MIVTYDRQNIFIIQATASGLYYKHMTIVNEAFIVVLEWGHNFESL